MNAAIKNLYNTAVSLIKLARIASVDDSGNLRLGYVDFLDKKQRVNVFSPYGLMHHPPAGSVSILFSLQGQESNTVSISDDPKNRPIRDMKEGEVAIGNYMTGDHAYFDEDGNLTGVVTKDLDLTIGANSTVEIGGNASVTVAGNIAMTGANISLTSSTLTHNGRNIGISHRHGDVEAGSDITSEPF